MGPQPHTYS
eukprot:gene22008-biopygen20704